MATFSEPFRLFLVTDPETGARRQLSDKGEAEMMARAIAQRTGLAAEELLTASRYYYTFRYIGARKTLRVNTRCTTLFEARRWIEDRQAMAREGIREARKIAFAEAGALWIEEKVTARRAAKTLTDYRCLVEVWKRFFGGLMVSEIHGEDVSRYFALREAGKFSAGGDDETKKPRARTLMKDRTLLSGFFAWARRRGLCGANPVEHAPRWTVEQNEPESLTAAEVNGLLRACREPYAADAGRAGFRPYSLEREFLPPPYLYGIVLTALHSLLRFGNVARLTWSQVDLDRGLIRLAGAEMKNRRAVEIPLTPTLKAYLSELPRGAPAAPVFGGFVGSVKKAFRSAARRAGLPGLKFHTLRKTGATLLLNEGVPLKVVQVMGGWRRPDVILRHYAAVDAAQRARAVEVLDKLGG